MNSQDTQVLVVRMSRLVEMIGLSRSTIWKLLSEGKFPNPIRLGSRSIAWRINDIEEWLQSRQELTTHRRNG
jgi:prophage regulatory protein